MRRNISIAYILSFLRNSWFWMGIWVFYYLRFTNYAGIGFIETAMIIAFILSEIPTGVVADLFGKKRTLTISFILQTLGMFCLAFSQNIIWLSVGVFLAGIGGSFYSGTLDALVYESLKTTHEEEKYDKTISFVNSISLIAPALCGLIGGYFYLIQPNLPFILNAFFYAVGIPLTFFLTEPVLEKSHSSPLGILMQIRFGFHQLFKNKKVIHQTILLFAIGFVVVICLEMLNDFLGIEFGFTPTQLSIFWSGLYILCALATHTTPYLKKYISYKSMILILGILIGCSLIISPFVGIIIGGVSIAIRAIFQSMYANISSVLINQDTDSAYRTTTLSAFNLLKYIPYVFSAYFLGTLSDTSSARKTALFLGSVLLVFLIAYVAIYAKRKFIT